MYIGRIVKGKRGFDRRKSENPIHDAVDEEVLLSAHSPILWSAIRSGRDRTKKPAHPSRPLNLKSTLSRSPKKNKQKKNGPPTYDDRGKPPPTLPVS